MSMSRQNFHESHEASDPEDDEDNRTIFCANLDERVTEDLLYEVFLQAGPIESARIPKDNCGRQRTFGFITYIHNSSAPYAMRLFQGLVLYRRPVTIKYKESTQQSPIRNYASPAYSNKPSTYDSSSLRSGNHSSYNDSPLKNPFRTSPDFSTNSSKNQQNVSKHASSHRRPHINVSPYERKSGGDRDWDTERDHNRGRHYNNGSNRHSDQRSSKKNRR